ncbi:MAG: hypothetical protein AAGB93_05940 [Planctomycetota bacterium]
MARARLLVLTQGRLDRLDDLVVAAGAERARVLRLDDALELFSTDAEDDCLAVLDLDATPVEDAGLLRRWLGARAGARLLWVGSDVGRVEVLAAAGAPGTFLGWPLDVEDLAALAREAAGAPPADRVPPLGAHAPTAGHSDAAPREGDLPRNGPAGDRDSNGSARPMRRNGKGELGAIEAILGTTRPDRRGSDGRTDLDRVVGSLGADGSGPRASQRRAAFLRFEAAPRPTPAPHRPSGDPPIHREDLPASDASAEGLELDLDGPLLTEEELEAFFDPAPLSPMPEAAAEQELPEEALAESSAEAPAEAAVGAAALDVASRQPGWLKDQTADLADIVMALDLRARASHAHVGLEGELARLRQFTRTIGYVAAPPAAGEQDFDVAVLVEEQLGGLAGTSPDSPRLLFRTAPEAATTVRADKALVSMALDALLRAAVGCAGAGDVVRVSVDGAETGPAVRIEFPRGPLADLRPEDVLEPYALKTRLPEIGSNALAAAGGIAVGQGGDLLVSESTAETLAFEVSFAPPRPA